MTLSPRIVVVAIGVLVVGWFAWGAADRTYITPRGEMRADLDKARQQMRAIRTALDDATRVEGELRDFAARTLGGDVETVDHRLRSRLNRLAEAVSLEKAAVGTGAASQKHSPARQAFERRGAWKTLRDEIDLVELGAWVSGECSLPVAIELVDRITSEPWLKRIDHVRLDPRDDGERFAVTVRLTTLFLPGRAPERAPEAEYDSARFARFEGFVHANPFRVARAATAPPPDPGPDPGPPPFPWSNWRLSGVAEGAGGPEIWLRNEASSRTRSLSIGEKIGGATLVSIEGEIAQFTLEDDRFQIRVGEHLNDREPVRD